MSVLLDKLIAKKEYWTQIGFTYGQMIIDFVYMYENNLDIYLIEIILEYVHIKSNL